MERNQIVFVFAALAIILSVSLMSATRSESMSSENEIKFFEGTWEQAVAKAKTENKPIFLDIYATWCGPCKMLKRNTFSDKTVGNYFNANYINISIDGEESEGLTLMQHYKLNAYPSLLTIDTTENPILVATGYRTPESLIEFGKQSMGKIN